MQNKCNIDQTFLSNILFTDEAKFYLNSHVCNHNMFYWSRSNPHWYENFNNQHKRNINVWAGILGDSIIGPFFYEEALNGENYLQILQTEIGEAVDNLATEEIWYQHDGAPAHYLAKVRQFLDASFPDHWIGRRGTIEWPARSPDLSPLDFFLWGYLKAQVFQIRSNNIEELKTRIANVFNDIPPDILAKVRKEFYDRLGYCLLVNGDNFEHLIK